MLSPEQRDLELQKSVRETLAGIPSSVYHSNRPDSATPVNALFRNRKAYAEVQKVERLLASRCARNLSCQPGAIGSSQSSGQLMPRKARPEACQHHLAGPVNAGNGSLFYRPSFVRTLICH